MKIIDSKWANKQEPTYITQNVCYYTVFNHSLPVPGNGASLQMKIWQNTHEYEKKRKKNKF